MLPFRTVLDFLLEWIWKIQSWFMFFLAWPTLSKAGMFGLGKPEHIARTCKYATICVYVIYRIGSYFYALEAEYTGVFGITTRYVLLDHFTTISSLPRPKRHRQKPRIWWKEGNFSLKIYFVPILATRESQQKTHGFGMLRHFQPS